MLSEAEKNKLRQRLDELREELDATLTATARAGATVELDQTRQGRLSRMDAMQGQAMAQASHARAHGRLQAIDMTRQRLDAVDYGECVECGEAIAFARLHIDPTLRLCIHCAEAAGQ